MLWNLICVGDGIRRLGCEERICALILEVQYLPQGMYREKHVGSACYGESLTFEGHEEVGRIIEESPPRAPKWVSELILNVKYSVNRFTPLQKKIRFSRIILEVVDWNPFWSPWAIFPHNPVLHYADTSWKNKTGENDGISLRLRLCFRIVWDYQKIFPLLDLTVVIDSFSLSDILAGD